MFLYVEFHDHKLFFSQGTLKLKLFHIFEL